eukprot:TRINITY_DN4060_c0_g1_i1.p1 TRINITY_DN4060_c0_g1~~TRINITY_DN4060_c0_g1_i1.p1  ORF type:complete len:573 (+),score=95.64 TRINITY_DN4060_c0_g1_i1:71-1789(+)
MVQPESYAAATAASPAQESSSSGTDPCLVDYINNEGVPQQFDIAAPSCAPFGFFFQDKVKTPEGEATVIGLRDGQMWLHVDGQIGAKPFPHKDEASFKNAGIEKMRDSTAAALDLEEGFLLGTHKVKQVQFGKDNINIIMQNTNGPCPLVAIANALLLEGRITLANDTTMVTVQELCNKISQYLQTHPPTDPQQLAQYQDYMAISADLLLNLQQGMDINPRFDSNDGFEASLPNSIMGILGIPMYHAWLVDPDFEGCEVIKKYNYDELNTKLVCLAENVPSSPVTAEGEVPLVASTTATSTTSSSDPATTATEPTSSPPQNKDQQQAGEQKPATGEGPPQQQDEQQQQQEAKCGTKRKRSEAELAQQGTYIRLFLETTSTQVTPYGLQQLRKVVPPCKPAMFFRNNHFSTIYKHTNGNLYGLVTDIGYSMEPFVVWETLEAATSEFFSHDFIPTEYARRNDIVQKILRHHSYTKQLVENVYDELCQGSAKYTFTLGDVVGILKTRHGAQQRPFPSDAVQEQASLPSTSPQQQQPPSADVATLMDLGFGREQCEKALADANGNVEQAANRLLM